MVSNSAILRTLIYSDIFDYPLTKEEIWKFLIEKKINKDSLARELKTLIQSTITPLGCNRGFYFLSGRGEIVGKRINRQKESQRKINIAKKIIQKLSIIPTVLFIGISGGLALENSDGKDDIDLFVITSKGSLWITRLILVVLLILMGQYRGRGKRESQKICLNMLISESGLAFGKDRRNLYTAHEIAQLKSMFDRNNYYEMLKFSNKWILEYLPNTDIKRVDNKEKMSFLNLFEKLAKAIQLVYMRGHMTSETISDNMLAFHPFEYKNYVLKEYNKRLRKYEI